MSKPDAAIEISPDTRLKFRLGVFVAIIVFIVTAVSAAYHFHKWLSDRFESHDGKLEQINQGQSNILFAVRRCWSVEDQQNWTDAVRETQPDKRWPSPNETIRKRLSEAKSEEKIRKRFNELGANQ